MQQPSPPSDEIGITGIVVFTAVFLVALLGFMLGWPARYKERQRALKGLWMSWAEDPAQKGGDGDGGGDGGCG